MKVIERVAKAAFIVVLLVFAGIEVYLGGSERRLLHYALAVTFLATSVAFFWVWRRQRDAPVDREDP